MLAILINLVILGAFSLGVWTASKAWRRLQGEVEALVGVRGNYGHLGQDQAASSAEIAEVLVREIMPADAQVCTRVRDLQEIRQREGEINHEALAASTIARLSLRTSVLRYIAGILILIGLVGTLLGLTQAVIGLSTYQASVEARRESTVPQGDERSSDFDKRISRLYEMVDNLFGSIEQTLAGMRSAFIASLLAISLTLVLTLLNHLLLTRQTRFLSDLEDFTTKHLIPLFMPPKVEDSLKSLADSLKEGTAQVVATVEAIEDRSIKVGSNLEYVFMLLREFDAGRKRFDASVEKVAEHQLLLQQGQQQMAQTIQRFIGGVDQLAGSEVALREAIELLKSFCTANAGLGHTLEQGIAVQQAMQQELSQFAARSEDLFSRRLTGLLTQEHQLFTEGLAEQRAASQALLQAVKQGIALQQNSDGLLTGIVQRQEHEQALSRKQILQLLEPQRQSVERLGRVVELLQLLQSGSQSLEERVAEGVTLQDKIGDLLQELLNSSTDVQGLSAGLIDPRVGVALERSRAPLTGEQPSAGDRQEILIKLQSQYFQKSTYQLQAIANSLERIQASLQARPGRLQRWLSAVQQRFPWRRQG